MHQNIVNNVAWCSGHASYWGDVYTTQVDEKFAYENSEMHTNKKK